MPLKTLGVSEHNQQRRWIVEFHPDFLEEFRLLPEDVRRHAYALIEVLAIFGPQLGRPRVDTLNGSKHSNMKEIRFRAHDGAWRIAFAFDVRQRAILLVGGDKSGVSEKKFYRNLIEMADRRFDHHLALLSKESNS